ncbi:MAG: RNA polymerase sigma factor, partial [Alphaproteobacteria bacterium]|nr:RNA polymerase sigma factor [Alphaproteobacteria bacterium]
MVIDDTLLVERFRQGDRTAAQAIVQKHNQMLWRVARGIVRDDAEAEEALQNAYVRALTSLDGFRGESTLATWLSRIVVNEALRRRAHMRTPVDLADVVETLPPDHPGSATMPPPPSPEAVAAREQIRRLVEGAIDALPAPFRIVFIMRMVEQMSINETAASLGIPVATAKTRLHRANQHLRATLGAELAAVFDGVFPFGGARCERLTQAVLARLPIENSK